MRRGLLPWGPADQRQLSLCWLHSPSLPGVTFCGTAPSVLLHLERSRREMRLAIVSRANSRKHPPISYWRGLASAFSFYDFMSYVLIPLSAIPPSPFFIRERPRGTRAFRGSAHRVLRTPCNVVQVRASLIKDDSQIWEIHRSCQSKHVRCVRTQLEQANSPIARANRPYRWRGQRCCWRRKYSATCR